MKMKLWWGVNAFWVVLAIVNVIFIMVRRVDGHGVLQTPQLRLAALAVTGAFLIFIALCQALALYFIRHSSAKH